MCNIFDHKSGDVTAYNNLESCLEATLTDLYLKLTFFRNMQEN